MASVMIKTWCHSLSVQGWCKSVKMYMGSLSINFVTQCESIPQYGTYKLMVPILLFQALSIQLLLMIAATLNWKGCFNCVGKISQFGAGEVTQQGRTLATFTLDQSLILRNHIHRHTSVCNSSSRGMTPILKRRKSLKIHTHPTHIHKKMNA